MRLQRQVHRRTRNGVVIVRLAIGAIVAVFVTGVFFEPRSYRFHGETKADIASAMVKKYAYEAYPSWAVSHPDERCPADLFALDEYMHNRDIKDPWGGDYEMYCGRRGIVVHSLGEDGERYTPDDVWSH